MIHRERVASVAQRVAMGEGQVHPAQSGELHPLEIGQEPGNETPGTSQHSPSIPGALQSPQGSLPASSAAVGHES